MPVRFEVEDAVALEDRKLLALVGAIREGMPRIGMTASAVDDDSVDFSEPVHGVEYVDAPSGVAGLALTFHYSSRDKLDGWREVRWKGRTLELGF